MWTLMMLGAGVLVGWQFPQPAFAKTVTDGMVRGVKALWAKYVG